MAQLNLLGILTVPWQATFVLSLERTQKIP